MIYNYVWSFQFPPLIAPSMTVDDDPLPPPAVMPLPIDDGSLTVEGTFSIAVPVLPGLKSYVFKLPC